MQSTNFRQLNHYGTHDFVGIECSNRHDYMHFLLHVFCAFVWVALPQELLYADDLAVIDETDDDLIKKVNKCKDNLKSKGMRVNMNKTKGMISGECQKVMQNAVRWPCGVCSKGVGNNSIRCTSCQKWVHKCSGIKGSMSKVTTS